MLPLLGLGLALGVRHAADPDHVVAVAAITARSRRVLPAAWLGVVWGLGHTLTLFVVGAAIIVFHVVIPPRLGLALEFAVAIALVVVGLLNLGHRHGENAPVPNSKLPAWRAFSVGLVHGLAGSAAVALLVLATVSDPWAGCAYLGVFGLGTLLGMALFTSGLAAPLGAASGRWPGFGRVVRLATGVIAIGFGAWLAVRIGFRDGLFLALPHWTPR